MIKSWLVASAMGLVLMGPISAWADLTLGVFPHRPVNQTVPAFTPLAEKLSAELGEKVTLVVAKDFDAFWQNVTNKKYDIAHLNQYQYLKSKSFGYKTLVANEEQQQKELAGVLLVRKDSVSWLPAPNNPPMKFQRHSSNYNSVPTIQWKSARQA